MGNEWLERLADPANELTLIHDALVDIARTADSEKTVNLALMVVQLAEHVRLLERAFEHHHREVELLKNLATKQGDRLRALARSQGVTVDHIGEA